MVDYSEILMQSMDVLVSKRLSDLQFDKTIICTIIDTSNAEKGEYEVTDGATTFTAYSKDVTFKEEDSVYITIPNGDYGNQKLIVGKHVGQGESLTYISPLDTFINITGDLCNFTSTASLLANSMTTITNNGKTLQVPYRKTIWKGTVSNGKGFERLCIKADFKTWLKKLKVNSGNYGLCLFVSYLDKATVNAEDSIKIAQYILDSNDMYGNPYNFESFYTQSKTFDITNITGQITNLELVFYQDANFSTTTGEAAPTIDSSTGNNLMDNIFVQNISIGFGYDITKFTEDTVMIYCLNEPTYNLNNLTQENRKTLNLRWIRSTNEGIYSVDSEDEIPENAEIHWYKYQLKVQDEVDELAGPLWFEIEEGRNKLTLEVDPDVGEYTQQYKAIIEVPSRQWITNQLDGEMNIDYKLLKINAEGKSEDSEEVKLLSQYEFNIESQRKIFESDPIEFKSEVPVFDKMTADLINGLQIIVDENGYKGNYLLYNLSNQIQNSNEASKMRIMRATYKSLVTGEQTLDGAESIIWKIPLVNSMIYPPEDGKEYKSSDVATSYWVENGYAYIKRLSGKSAAASESAGTMTDWSAEQKFRIKDYYQESATNNTVYCYVVKNNVAYEASAEMFFGPKSSNGTDFTFRMGFESDIPAVTKGQNDVIRVNFQMFDFNNDKVPNFWQNGIDVNWYSSDGDNKIIFCNADGNAISVENEFDFFDASGNKITTAGKVAASVKVYTNHFYIKLVKSGVPNYYVAEAFVTADPTIKAGQAQLNHIRLSCQLLIPYRDSDVYDGIEGATKVLYSSSGTNPEFYDGRYKLWQDVNDERVQVDANWSVVLGTSDSLGVQLKYYPRLAEGDKLLLPSVFTEGLDKRICIQAKSGNTVLWSHPIVLMKDAYSSAMLNAWDGNLTIDNENGTILSMMIGAGKKELDNSYSGVLMGDVKCALDDVTKIGLYGFNFGLQSFGWMVDGTGFIGKNGQGQIRFNGNRGTISSGVWETSNKKIGMEIDLDGDTGTNETSTGSTLKMKGLAGTISFDTSAKTNSTDLFVIQGRVADGVDEKGNPTYEAVTVTTDDSGKKTTLSKTLKYKDMIKISVGNLESDEADGKDAKPQKSSFYMQSLNFNASNKTGTRIDLQNGKITSYGTHGRLEIATSSTTFFRLADLNNKPLFLIKSTTGDTDGETTSQYYLQSSNFDGGSKAGTRLDLQNGKFTTYGNSGYVIIDSGNSAIFRVFAKSSDQYYGLMYIGNSSTYYIQNLNWATSNGAKGSKWDLNNGSFKAFGDGGKISIQPNIENALFVVQTNENNTIMNVGKGAYYLQSADYKSDNSAGFQLDLANGNLQGANFAITLTKGSNVLTIGSKDCTNAIQIKNGTSERFSVHWDGSVFLRGDATLTVESGKIQSGGGDTKGKYYSLTKDGGTIGPWHINEKAIWTGTSLSNPTSKLGTDGTILLRGDNMELKLTSSLFQVTNVGGASSSYPQLLLGEYVVRLKTSANCGFEAFTGMGGTSTNEAKLMASNICYFKVDPDVIEARANSKRYLSIDATNGIVIQTSDNTAIKVSSTTIAIGTGIYSSTPRGLLVTPTSSELLNYTYGISIRNSGEIYLNGTNVYISSGTLYVMEGGSFVTLESKITQTIKDALPDIVSGLIKTPES